jgi:molybdopterin biosynthesis enzyme
MACFWLFARPAIRRMMGIDDAFWQGALRATLTAPLPQAKARDRFLPASIAFRRGEILAHPLRPQGSHDLAAFGRGTALVRIKAHSDAREAGDPCEILPLVNWTGG